MSSSHDTTRLPFYGSCHCGSTRYIVFLSLPDTNLANDDPAAARQDATRMYRCNCSTCHKSAMFHVRPANPHEDFLLLAPLDPFKELGDYRAFEGQVALFFCKTCGGRCFLTGGKGEVVDIDLEQWKSQGAMSGGKKIKAWRIRKDSLGRNGRPPYLSINAHSIEVDQGLDMRALTKLGLVEYMDCRRDGEDKRESRYDYPHDGGSF